ncbi:MAG: 50S ribosomal protein L13 [Candidatus Pacebacteria bacterium]|nr:50S ribosomal protein L13 [Candidatus Paceibacterota bacterium]MDR3583165.1 50S ribosomal protein L13 [Candidatus Paceibacterota bacterium]
MKTITRKYHQFDAKSKSFGRLATEIALVLRGKNKADFTPNIDGGDFVVVINTDNLKATGGKMDKKIYHYFSGYPGGVRNVALKDKIKQDSREVIKEAVYGMLCKNKLRDRMMTRLKIYKDDKHEHKIEITH